MPTSTCLNCGASSQEKPLLLLKFQEKEFYICPQCMPTLIHEPQKLAEKLPGYTPTENTAPHEH